jgi:hypothetical protein
MQIAPLNFEYSIVANAQGGGTIEKGPETPGVKWNLATAGVKSSSTTLVPTCTIFMNNVMVDGTYTGTLDSSGMVDSIPLTNGQKIKAVWTGADVGATLTLSITGTSTSNYR